MTSKIHVGDVFCRLTVLELIADPKNPRAKCLCECGSIVSPQRGALLNGRAKSCGCLRSELLRSSGLRHGMHDSAEYKAYTAMIGRCNNKNDAAYRNYGGRGIMVLYRSFDEFLLDVGRKKPGQWIDRIDNNLHYQIGNCRWVSTKESQVNKRVCKRWTVDGREYISSTDAAANLGVSVTTIIRGCSGYRRGGVDYPPKDGWSCRLAYPDL